MLCCTKIQTVHPLKSLGLYLPPWALLQSAALLCPSNWPDSLEGRAWGDWLRRPLHCKEVRKLHQWMKIRRKAQKADIGFHAAAQHLCSCSCPEDKDQGQVGLILCSILHLQIHKAFSGPLPPSWAERVANTHTPGTVAAVTKMPTCWVLRLCMAGGTSWSCHVSSQWTSKDPFSWSLKEGLRVRSTQGCNAFLWIILHLTLFGSTSTEHEKEMREWKGFC